MYGQFLYFIVAIFIYAAYSPSGKTNFSFWEALGLFLVLWVIFAVSTRMAFAKIKRDAPRLALPALDRKYDAANRRFTIGALIFFAIDIYALNLPDYLLRFPLFSAVPTLCAAACLCIFACRMVFVWKYGYGIHQKLYRRSVSLYTFVTSNLRLSAPVALPWLVLSFFSDLLNLLPFDSLNAFLSSAGGEILYFIFFLFIIATIGPFFLQKLWRCTPIEPGVIRDRIDRLCSIAGMSYKDILYWPVYEGKMITAGVMGLVKKFRYILITPALLRILDGREMDAVIAHEIGHIKKKHLLFYLLFFIGYLLFSSFLLNVFRFGWVYLAASGNLDHGLPIGPVAMGSFTLNGLFIVAFIVYFRYVFGFFIRNFERQADAYVYRFFESARPLITTLEKIALSGGISPEKPNWHHFSINERTEFLNQCENDRTRVRRHDQKIKKGLALYLIGVLALVSVEAGINFSDAGKNLEAASFEKAILMRLEKFPKDPLLYGDLGDLYQAVGKYEQAVAAYETSLRLYPQNPDVLNNLAWLLTTCPDPQVKNPRAALVMAEKAIGLKESSPVLDTLAEVYFVNSDYEQAIETGRKALEHAIENKAYYRGQLKKFESAAKKQAGDRPGLND